MNFNININQYAGVTHFTNLDLIDLAIFDYIKNFQGSCEKLIDVHGIWFWISHTKLQKDMPLIKIGSKTGLINRMNKLIEYKIIDRHPESKKLSKSYYKPGENWEVLIKVDTSQSELRGPLNTDCEAPLNTGCENNNTNNDHYTKDQLLKLFREITGKNVRVVDDKAWRQFKARIKEGFTLMDFEIAIRNCKNDKYHVENPHFLTIEFITRSDKFTRYLNYSNKPKKIERQTLQNLDDGYSWTKTQE